MQPNYEKHILLKIKLHGVSVLSSKTKRQAKQNRDFGCEELRTELKAKSRIPFVLSISNMPKALLYLVLGRTWGFTILSLLAFK